MMSLIQSVSNYNNYKPNFCGPQEGLVTATKKIRANDVVNLAQKTVGLQIGTEIIPLKFNLGNIEKATGKLRQEEGQTYTLGLNQAVFHYLADRNIGYFTSVKDKHQIIGVIVPTKNGDVCRYIQKNGDIVDAEYTRDPLTNKQIQRKPDGTLVSMSSYVNGKEENKVYA